MRKKNRHKNSIHKKLMILLGTCILILSTVTGCGQTHKKEIAPTPGVDKEQGQKDVARIHFIDTGNSDAILIEQSGHAALIDGGDNNDEKLVVDYINELGIERLDYVFATHPDADHIGGLDAVMTELEVGQVLVSNGTAKTKTYTDFIQAIMDKGLTPSVPILGATFPLGDATLTIMSVANVKDVNNCSLVILYTYGEKKAIFMGDADQGIEGTIDVKLVGDVDLIKVGHHGSKTSSNEDFIKAIAPEYAVITCGEGNKYNHPEQVTLDTLNKLGLSIYRTDQMGDIIFEVTNNSITPLQESPIKSEVNEVSKVEPTTEEEVVEAFKPMEEGTGSIVYYTLGGKRYHKDKNCSDMKNPIAATIDEVGERTPCQKCYN